ncbi:MAG: DnaA/Hda family protein [Nitrospinota bacterium]|nr:DnaA/Hda family protein [Nitrospinota bacterium]
MSELQLKLDFPKDRLDTFDNLVVAAENQDSVDICSHFLDQAPGAPFSLVIHGPRYCGKTHLLGAMGAVAAKKVGPEAAVYLDCAALTAGKGARARFGRPEEYARAMENAHFLAVDHLEAAQDDSQLCDLVFHLFNEVTRRPGGRFAAAIGASPPEWRFPDWLRTRLLWGHVAPIRPVGDELRPRVLVKMAADMRMTLPHEVAVWLVTHLPRDPESQMRVLAQVDTRSLTTGKKVSISLIKSVLEQNNGG